MQGASLQTPDSEVVGGDALADGGVDMQCAQYSSIHKQHNVDCNNNNNDIKCFRSVAGVLVNTCYRVPGIPASVNHHGLDTYHIVSRSSFKQRTL